VLHNYNKNVTIPYNIGHLEKKEHSQKNKNHTLVEQENNSSLHKKCAVCVHIENIPVDLKLIMDAWPKLPKELRLQIAKAVLETII